MSWPLKRRGVFLRLGIKLLEATQGTQCGLRCLRENSTYYEEGMRRSDSSENLVKAIALSLASLQAPLPMKLKILLSLFRALQKDRATGDRGQLESMQSSLSRKLTGLPRFLKSFWYFKMDEPKKDLLDMNA
jgi:hypothetical protein